jgi:glyoxylase-like metal-dependent hydrolase (beta-lactamase superfamily II)
MRRILAALLAGASLVLHAEDAPLTVDMKAIRVTDRVYYVQGRPGVASAANEGFNSNAGFVITDEGVVVIDALGTPALGLALYDTIGWVSPQPVRRVILTHYHADHFYGLGAFKAAGADVWAQERSREYLDGGEAERRLEQRSRDLFPWVDERMPIVRPDHWVGESERFTLGHVRFELYHMGPAHSPEDLIIALPDEGVVFVGDILFAGRIPFVGEADSRLWLQRIDALLAMHPRILVTGHGEASRDPQKDLALTRDYLVFLRKAMGDAVENFVPFEEAYAKTDWGRFAKLPAFEAANRVNAYGTYLLMEKEMLTR